MVRDTNAGLDRHSNHGAIPERSLIGRLTAGGTAGNERLTADTGIVLLVLLAVIGVTILWLRSLLWVHLFVGMLLIGPIALKMASTGYRFVRYYTADPYYRRKGPPPAPLRMLAPLVVISTVTVFLSGVALLLIGPSSRDTLLPIHKVSFIAWVLFTSLHVLGHLPEVAAAVGLGGETASKVDVLAALGSTEGVDLGLGDPGRRTHCSRRACRTRTLTCRSAGGRHGARYRRYSPIRPVAARLAPLPPPLSTDDMRLHTHTRDAALRRLDRVNRWLIAGSVALTAVFAEIAASAFPGKSAAKTPAVKQSGSSGHSSPSASSSPTESVQPPAQAPQARNESTSTQTGPTQEPAPSQESAPTHESAPAQEAAAPTQESAPSAPAQESAPTHESAPAQESAPVVSGGS